MVMIKSIRYFIIFTILTLLVSCESRYKKLEGKWVVQSLSSEMLEENVKNFPENMRAAMEKHKDSVMQLKVDSMYIEFEMDNYKGTKGIINMNVYDEKELALWRYLEESRQIHLYDPEKEDRYWDILELTEATLTIKMNDRESDWEIHFIRQELKDTALKLAQK